MRCECTQASRAARAEALEQAALIAEELFAQAVAARIRALIPPKPERTKP